MLERMMNLDKEVKSKWEGKVDLDVFDLIGDLKKCFNAKVSIECQLDELGNYLFLDQLIMEKEQEVWDSLEELIGVVIHN